MSDEEKDVPPHSEVIRAFFFGCAVTAVAAVVGLSIGTTLFKLYF